MFYGLDGIGVGTSPDRRSAPRPLTRSQTMLVCQFVKRIPNRDTVTVQENPNFALRSVAVLVQFVTIQKQYKRPTPLNCWNWTVTSDTDNDAKNMAAGHM
jgi:hypothetical protein